MNSTVPPILSLKSLYHCDFTIRRSVNTMGFWLFAAIGIYWVAQPVPSVVQVEKSPIEIWILEWGMTVAFVVAALALLVLVRRFLWINKVLCQGTPIQGIVEDVDIHEREAPRTASTTAFGVAKIRSYYAIIRYAWQGVDNRVRLKLPFSPSTCQLFKGREVELIVLDSMPQKPLISTVYLRGILPSKGSWYRSL